MASCEEIVLYTCIVADRDKPTRFLFMDDFKYVMFSDKPVVRNGWEVVPITYHDDDPVRIARYYKHNPFVFFPNCKFAIWLDATHWQIRSLKPLLSEDFDISLMRHFSRKSAFEEAKVCKELIMDDPKKISNQVDSYRREGFADDQGLFSTTCLIRKNNQKCVDFCEFWWSEISRWSKRDQISFPYCKWKTSNLIVREIPGFCRSSERPKAKSDYFRMKSHYRKSKFY